MGAEPEKRKSASERLKALLLEYGRVALGVYLALFAVVFAAFAVAISMGIEAGGAGGIAGTAAAAWVATKLTQPLRIAGTLVLTPLVGVALQRRGRGDELGDGPDPVCDEAADGDADLDR